MQANKISWGSKNTHRLFLCPEQSGEVVGDVLDDYYTHLITIPSLLEYLKFSLMGLGGLLLLAAGLVGLRTKVGTLDLPLSFLITLFFWSFFLLLTLPAVSQPITSLLVQMLLLFSSSNLLQFAQKAFFKTNKQETWSWHQQNWIT